MYIQQKILLQIMTAVCFLVLLSPYFAWSPNHSRATSHSRLPAFRR
jgi:hypothetical protein